MEQTLEVHIAEELAGVITQRPNGNFRLEYDATYVEGALRIPLSYSMPLTRRTHGTRPITNWMWGLLPDNEATLSRWAQRYKVSARNPFALLREMGEDCPGAVQLAPPGFDRAGSVCLNIADELLAAAAEREARQIDEKLFLEICATPPAATPRSAAGRRR